MAPRVTKRIGMLLSSDVPERVQKIYRQNTISHSNFVSFFEMTTGLAGPKPLSAVSKKDVKNVSR